jgi:hypothetical protein
MYQLATQVMQGQGKADAGLLKAAVGAGGLLGLPAIEAQRLVDAIPDRRDQGAGAALRAALFGKPRSAPATLYIGNGAVDAYDFTFRIFDDADLVVLTRDADGVEVTLALGADYTVAGAGSYDGGTITLVDGALASGYTITIKRVLDLTQETSLQNQSAFYAKVHEDEFDRLVMVDQQQQDQIDRSLKIAATEAGGDAVTQLPGPEERASKFLGFDADGNVAALDGDMTGVAVETVVQVVDTIAALRALSKPATAVTYLVRGYYATGDGGGGTYRWNSADTSTDNGGTIVPANAGGNGRWNLVHGGEVSFRQFGAKGDGATADVAKCQAALSSGVARVKGKSGDTYLVAEAGTKTILGTVHHYCLTIPTGVELDLCGATIKRADAANSIVLLNEQAGTSQDSNILVRGGTIDGNFSNQTAPATGEIPNLMLYNVDYARVEDMRFLNARDYFARFLAVARSRIVRCWGLTTYGDGFSFGIQASSQEVTDSFIDQIYAEDVRGTYGTLQGNPMILTVKYCQIGHLEGNNCHGGLKIQDSTTDSAFTSLTFRGGALANANSGVKVQGNSGAGLYPTGVRIGRVVSESCYAEGLYVIDARDVSIDSYLGDGNAKNAAGTLRDVFLDTTLRLRIGHIDSRNACAAAVGIGVVINAVDDAQIGTIHVLNVKGVAVQDQHSNAHGPVRIGDIIVHDDNAGGTELTTFAFRATGSGDAQIGTITTNLARTNAQARVSIAAGNYLCRWRRYCTGSTNADQAVVAPGVGVTTVAVACAHAYRVNAGGTDYVHPVVSFLPLNAAARTLGAPWATVPEYTAGSGITVNLPGAAAGTEKYLMTIDEWLLVAALPA